MKAKQKLNSTLYLAVFFGLSLALSACAPLSSPESQTGWEERVALLEKKLQEVSAQVEKNRTDIQEQAARIDSHQALLDRSTAEKVTPEAPKTGFDATPSFNGSGEFTPAAVYREAFGNYAAGRYQQAVMGFRAFLDHFPDNVYAPNAHFWMGESLYALAEYPQALKEFDTLVGIQPPNDKAPEALERMVDILKKLQEDDKARETAGFLLKNYPDSPAAKTLQQSFPEFRTP
jgi:tol-pal system protein YbgF